MKPLEKALRNQLEKTVREAREIAETAAKIALEQLAVGEANPFPHLNEEERELRRKLRVHGRQLGDSLNGEKIQTMVLLIEEVAYEHWHRMLFTRFLAQNNLLMYPDPDNSIPVTLEECKDLAKKENMKNGWEVAAHFAASMLPQIFRPESPVFQLSIPPECQQKLEQLIEDLPPEVFTASDSIGWVYQFWQTKKKDEVNKSGVKIGPRELPVVTQLFTEPYMVNFLLDNSIGAWWAARRLTKEDLAKSSDEESLRGKASIAGVPLTYTRFIQQNGIWKPAAGTFDNWPENLSNLRIIDPCCGSGHFLVAAFLMLVPMRMEIEGLSAKDAVHAVLEQNLFGLEIDKRCVELAAFSLAFSAWRFRDAGGYRQLPELNVACSGLGTSVKKADWLALAGNNAQLGYTLGELYEQFKDAPILGSLIDPEKSLGKGTLTETKFEEVTPLLTKILSEEKDDEKTEMEVIAYGLAKATTFLSRKYHLVVTNVPYLAQGRQNEFLRAFCENYYSEAKKDLATVFLSRCLKFCDYNGVCCIVLPQNWLFLSRYKKFREKLLKNNDFRVIVRLGERGFESSAAAGAFPILALLDKSNTQIKNNANLDDYPISCIDVSTLKSTYEKASQLQSAQPKLIPQTLLLKNTDFVITFEPIKDTPLLSEYAMSFHGISTTDYVRFGRCFWEIPQISSQWLYQQGTLHSTEPFSGKTNILFWENGRGQLFSLSKTKAPVVITGIEAWGKKGVAVTQMRKLPCTFYMGTSFDDNTCVIVPYESSNLAAIWSYCSSEEYHQAVREIDQTLKVTYPTLVKVPFDIKYWKETAQKNYPNGLPQPYSNDPTQWIFHGHPLPSDEPLQVAVARLLGYQWPSEIDNKMELSNETARWVKETYVLRPFGDEDGIVCIPSVRGEPKAEERLENLLATAFGTKWSPAKKAELLAKADNAGKTLESWLREKFFIQHCTLFQNRPFIWHIWDGLNDGFAVLVNYHKLDYKLLETLIYNYLGDWISQQRHEKARCIDGSEEKLAAAEMLKKRLELILEGEKPFDIFVRWKSIEQQPIGWNPDLNDGVRVNIRPFMMVQDVGKKGAGVLRDKPNIDWGKDRGRDLEFAPWFKLGPIFGGYEGDRINNHHLSLSEKCASTGNKETKMTQEEKK